MSEKNVQLNEEVVKGQIKELVRGKSRNWSAAKHAKNKKVLLALEEAMPLPFCPAEPAHRKESLFFPNKSSYTAALQCGCFIHPGIIHSFAQGHPWLCFRQSGASVPP